MRLLLFLLLITPALAHVPTNSNTITNPEKSWVIYTEYTNETLEYELIFDKTGILSVSLFTIEKDLGAKITLLKQENEIISATGVSDNIKDYEPFTPTSYYPITGYKIIINETGNYQLQIDSMPGKIGLAIGYKEEFSLIEWLSIPVETIRIHLWEGQNIIIILMPAVITILIGLMLIKKLNAKTISALLYLASSMVTLSQMIIGLQGAVINASITVTIIFILMPLLLAYAIQKTDNQIKHIVYGLLGLITWSGFIIGPFLLISDSIMRVKNK